MIVYITKYSNLIKKYLSISFLKFQILDLEFDQKLNFRSRAHQILEIFNFRKILFTIKKFIEKISRKTFQKNHFRNPKYKNFELMPNLNLGNWFKYPTAFLRGLIALKNFPPKILKYFLTLCLGGFLPLLLFRILKLGSIMMVWGT